MIFFQVLLASSFLLGSTYVYAAERERFRNIQRIFSTAGKKGFITPWVADKLLVFSDLALPLFMYRFNNWIFNDMTPNNFTISELERRFDNLFFERNLHRISSFYIPEGWRRVLNDTFGWKEALDAMGNIAAQKDVWAFEKLFEDADVIKAIWSSCYAKNKQSMVDALNKEWNVTIQQIPGTYDELVELATRLIGDFSRENLCKKLKSMFPYEDYESLEYVTLIKIVGLLANKKYHNEIIYGGGGFKFMNNVLDYQAKVSEKCTVNVLEKFDMQQIKYLIDLKEPDIFIVAACTKVSPKFLERYRMKRYEKNPDFLEIMGKHVRRDPPGFGYKMVGPVPIPYGWLQLTWKEGDLFKWRALATLANEKNIYEVDDLGQLPQYENQLWKEVFDKKKEYMIKAIAEYPGFEEITKKTPDNYEAFKQKIVEIHKDITKEFKIKTLVNAFPYLNFRKWSLPFLTEVYTATAMKGKSPGTGKKMKEMIESCLKFDPLMDIDAWANEQIDALFLMHLYHGNKETIRFIVYYPASWKDIVFFFKIPNIELLDLLWKWLYLHWREIGLPYHQMRYIITERQNQMLSRTDLTPDLFSWQEFMKKDWKQWIKENWFDKKQIPKLLHDFCHYQGLEEPNIEGLEHLEITNIFDNISENTAVKWIEDLTGQRLGSGNLEDKSENMNSEERLTITKDDLKGIRLIHVEKMKDYENEDYSKDKKEIRSLMIKLISNIQVLNSVPHSEVSNDLARDFMLGIVFSNDKDDEERAFRISVIKALPFWSNNFMNLVLRAIKDGSLSKENGWEAIQKFIEYKISVPFWDDIAILTCHYLGKACPRKYSGFQSGFTDSRELKIWINENGQDLDELQELKSIKRESYDLLMSQPLLLSLIKSVNSQITLIDEELVARVLFEFLENRGNRHELEKHVWYQNLMKLGEKGIDDNLRCQILGPLFEGTLISQEYGGENFPEKHVILLESDVDTFNHFYENKFGSKD